MAYDIHGRWVPSEDITWDLSAENRDALRLELTATGLDWRHEGKYAFRTDAWGQMSESQRLDTLQVYDSWYDEGGQLALNDEAWGLDIERGLTYNDSWDAQTAFNQLTGGWARHVERKGTVDDLINPEHKKDKVRHTIVSERTDAKGDTYTTFIEREHPMDWKHYSTDELYRATIDELMEDPKMYNMFIGPGDDFNNAVQVREANKEVQSWVDDAYKKAHELGKDGAWAENEFQGVKALQIARGKLTNIRYPEGRKAGGAVGGPLYNQQIAIRKYSPWNTFDPETGTRVKTNPITGEIRDTFKHKLVPEPTRMTIVGDKLQQNMDEGIFYSPTMGLEQEITDSMLAKPPDIPKPTNLTIRKVTPERPANVDAGWKLKGDVK
tara:strand:+ start:175 stop:1317 length:1143 start_codon:yes stop_codon:yes gene_type:complete